MANFSVQLPDVLSLAERALKDGLIDEELKDQVTILHQVPNSMKLRYLQACIRFKYKDSLPEQAITYLEAPLNATDDSLLGPDISDLIEQLVPYAHTWRFLGTALKILPQELDNIQSCSWLLFDSPKSYLVRLLEDWVMKKFTNALPPTRRSLVKALNSKIVGLGKLASTLASAYNEHTVEHAADYQRNLPYAILKSACQSFVVEENESTLLEIQNTVEAECSYVWFHNGSRIYNSSTSFLYLHEVDIDWDGSEFSCEIICDSEVVMTARVIMNVSCALDKYKKSLASMYLTQPEVPEDAWPPVGNKKFINLALIKQQKINYGSRYARLTIRGDADDILRDKDTIEYSEVYKSLVSKKLVLIEGRPGSGKTTFVHKITRDWARKTSGGIRLVLLVSLRMMNTLKTSNPDLSDILKLFRDLKVSKEQIEKRDGKGVCFIFDGLDEFSPTEGKNSIVYKIIEKTYLHQSVVIVASRPAAIAKLRNRADKVIEVLGFLKEQIFEYFHCYPFSDPLKPTKLCSYLLSHPNVLHMCYLPIHAAMVAFLFEVTGNVPKTETEIYTHFTRFTLKRSLTKDNGLESNNINLRSLSDETNKGLSQICQLALSKTLSNKQVLHEDEVGSFFRFAKGAEMSLDLVTIDCTADLYDFKNVYTFLHLTFQEYLAAHYISTLDDEEQKKLIKEHGKESHMMQVWKFYCGLVKNLENFELIIAKTKGNTLFHIHCAYESQQSVTATRLLESMNCDVHLHAKYLGSTDFTALGFIASVSVLSFKLSLIDCIVNIDAIDAFNTEVVDAGKNALQGLHVETVNASSDQMECIRKMLACLTSLKLIVVKERGRKCVCPVDDKDVLKLSNVTDVSLINSDIPHFGPLLDEMTYRNLTSLNLSQSIKRQSELLTVAYHLEACINLQKCNLSCNGIDGDGANVIVDRMCACINLKELNLCKNDIDKLSSDILTDGLQSWKGLETFNVCDNYIQSSEIPPILAALKQSINLKLKSADISQYQLSDKDLLNYLGNVPDLHSLDITLDTDSLALISMNSMVWKKLTELAIIFLPQYSMDAALTVFSCLQHFKLLQMLTLNYCIFDVEGAQALLSSMKPCHKLRILDLSHNRIGPAEVEFILPGITSFTLLEELNLDYNCLGDEGVKIISHYLPNLITIKRLGLSYNYIHEDGGRALAAIIRHCDQLENLNLDGNNIDAFWTVKLS